MGKTKIKTVEENTPVEEQPQVLETPVVEEVEVVKEEKKEAKTSAKSEKTDSPKQRHSNKYLEAAEKVERNKHYPLTEAIDLTKTTSYSKFLGTVEAHINTGQKSLRGLVSLPFAAGKKLTILAFGKGAKEAGADIEGTEEIIQEILKGKINFDLVVATPDWMPKLATTAKILGPRGLMPNPKSGTVSDNLEKTISELSSGKTEYKTEANGSVIHMSVGKTNQSSEEISENIKSLFNTLGKSRVKKITLSATMGPGVKIDLKSI